MPLDGEAQPAKSLALRTRPVVHLHGGPRNISLESMVRKQTNAAIKRAHVKMGCTTSTTRMRCKRRKRV